MNSLMGVYAIRHVATDRRYVGSTICFKSRWSMHRKQLEKGNHHNRRLLHAWRKYGEEAFVFEVLESVSQRSDLVQTEQMWITKLQATGKEGFNLCPIAGSCLGVKRTPEYKLKLSQSLRGRKLTDSQRAMISEAQRGRKTAEKTKLKMAEAQRLRRAAEAAARPVPPVKPQKDRYPGRARKISQSQIEAIVSQLKAGVRVRDIASHFGAHRTTVTKINLGAYFVKLQGRKSDVSVLPIKPNLRNGRSSQDRKAVRELHRHVQPVLMRFQKAQGDLFAGVAP